MKPKNKPTAAELNEWAAEYCGIEIEKKPYGNGAYAGPRIGVWNPCQDRDEAQMVVEKALSHGFHSKETDKFNVFIYTRARFRAALKKEKRNG